MHIVHSENMFGVGWLDGCFQRCLEDEDLQASLAPVSDGLAELIVGTYSSRTKQAALFSLVGPTFVRKHFSAEDPLKLPPSTEAAQSQIKPDLEALAEVAGLALVARDMAAPSSPAVAAALCWFLRRVLAAYACTDGLPEGSPLWAAAAGPGALSLGSGRAGRRWSG